MTRKHARRPELRTATMVMMLIMMVAMMMMMVAVRMMMVVVPGQSEDGGHVVQVARQDDEGDPEPEVTC